MLERWSSTLSSKAQAFGGKLIVVREEVSVHNDAALDIGVTVEFEASTDSEFRVWPGLMGERRVVVLEAKAVVETDGDVVPFGPLNTVDTYTVAERISRFPTVTCLAASG